MTISTNALCLATMGRLSKLPLTEQQHKERKALLKGFFKPTDKKVEAAKYVSEDEIEIFYTQTGKKYRMIVNLATGKKSVKEL